MERTMMRPTTILHPLVASIKQLALTVLCGVLLSSSALLAQDSPAVQPPQPPQSKQSTPRTHLRQGQPGVYQSFQPCRMVDTRNPDGPSGGPKLAAGGTRNFSLVPSGGDCGDTLPAGVTALAMNMTITGTENGGFLTVWPGGGEQPNASVINWTSSGTTVANAIIVPVGADGSINIFSSDATHVLLDVSGYYLSSLETDDQLGIVANNATAAIVGQNNGGGAGVRGEATSGPGVYGQSASGPAGYFAGPVEVAGNLNVIGEGNGIVFADGTTQTTAATGGGGGGVGGAGTAGALPLWTNGTTLGDSVITQSGNNVGIGTVSPTSTLDVRGNMVLDSGINPSVLFTAASGGEQNKYLGLFNSPTSPSASGLKAGGILVSDSFAFANPEKNDLIVKGNIGIGTTVFSSIAGTAKLSINGQNAIDIFGFQPLLTMTDNSGSGFIRAPARRLQSVDGTLGFSRLPTCFVFPCPSFITDMVLNSSGNLCIGTVSPVHRLSISGGPTWTSNGWTGSVELQNAAAIAWRSNSAGRRFGIGQSGGGLYFFHTNSDPGTTGSPAVYDMIIKDNGNVSVNVLEIQGGADFAENFDVRDVQPLGSDAPLTAVQPGMVVAIDPQNPGQLVVSHRAYSRHVAGIISGAGGVKPGMLMGQAGSIANGQHPVALSGRVYVRADATRGAIKPGDLLTTSIVPGHAMRVANHAKAQGAIIGKAMTGLKAGRGLVLVLVTLQ